MKPHPKRTLPAWPVDKPLPKDRATFAQVVMQHDMGAWIEANTKEVRVRVTGKRLALGAQEWALWRADAVIASLAPRRSLQSPLDALAVSLWGCVRDWALATLSGEIRVRTRVRGKIDKKRGSANG